MTQLYIATLLCSNSLLPTITFSKMKSLNSWNNRYSVPGATIRAGKIQYLNAQREFLKIYRLFFDFIYLRVMLFWQANYYSEHNTKLESVCPSWERLFSATHCSPFYKLLSYCQCSCGRFQRCIHTTMLPWLMEYMKHNYINTYVLVLCNQ